MSVNSPSCEFLKLLLSDNKLWSPAYAIGCANAIGEDKY